MKYTEGKLLNRHTLHYITQCVSGFSCSYTKLGLPSWVITDKAQVITLTIAYLTFSDNLHSHWILSKLANPIIGEEIDVHPFFFVVVELVLNLQYKSCCNTSICRKEKKKYLSCLKYMTKMSVSVQITK